MKRIVIVAIAILLLASVALAWQVNAEAKESLIPAMVPPKSDEEHIKWVARSLQEMLTVREGMTRADLLKVFGEQGGISHQTQRTYVYRHCLYFKVDVTFKPAHPIYDKDGRLTSPESPDDKITKISQPYLGYMVID